MAQLFLILSSFLIVAFGQPAWNNWLGLLTALVGYALFFRVLLDYSKPISRFWLATGWFFGIQLIQLSWVLSHPFYYIYPIYVLISFLLALQFGVIGWLITYSRISSIWQAVFIASVWTVFEWLRLFFFSGFTFNPVGLSLSGHLYPLQMASLWGVFGLSFWVIFVNLLALRAWFAKRLRAAAFWGIAAAVPYLYGAIQLGMHQLSFKQDEGNRLNALLVQTAFPVEEAMEFGSSKNKILYVIEEWRQVLNILKHYQQQQIDLIALPEFMVPFGTYSMVYPYETVKQIFQETFGSAVINTLPPLEIPLADAHSGWMVNNAYWAQAIANYFQAALVVGLEDAEDVNGTIEFYSAALFFQPKKKDPPSFSVERYEKRVLVPMGEYIPLSFFKELAASYGVMGSFTPGKGAKVMQFRDVPFGVSICYEETFGDLMRQNRELGAKLLVNLTSDVWYPNSRLPRQHLDLARLRTVENGIPLIRSCNTGITGALDSLGRTVATLGGDHPEAVEWKPDALLTKVPLYSYPTLYSKVGDRFIIAISLFSIFSTVCFGIWLRIKNR